MKTDFEITGLFYENKNLLCRKYLNIKRNGIYFDKPDLMVVMMNPGKSKPKDGNNKNTKSSKAISDKTQDQIIKIMDNCNFNYARILNLSDFRETKSKIFYSKLKELEKIPHSIFDDDRINDFETLFIKNIPIIFAWGVDKRLMPLANKAIKRINVLNPFGLLKKDTISSYYHPLPHNYYEQEKWCEEITEQIFKSRVY